MNCERDSPPAWDEKLCVMGWEGTGGLTVAAKCEPFWIPSGRPAQSCQAAGRSAFPSLIVNELRAGRSEFEFRQEQEIILFLLYKKSRPALRTVQCVPGKCGRGLQLTSASAEVKNERSCTSAALSTSLWLPPPSFPARQAVE